VDEDDALSAADALATMLAAVGVSHCRPCTCDAGGSTSIAAPDALMLLKKAVGEAVTRACDPRAVASAQTLRASAGP
jgi:hypothetical protein